MLAKKKIPSACDLSEAIKAGRTSVVETLEVYLARIAQEDSYHHAFKSVFVEEATRQAQLLDEELAAGRWRGPLHGMPVAIKDNIEIRGHAASAGSLARVARTSAEDAPVVARLREAGAIILGQTHMVEFAFGGWGTNSAMGTPRNPLDRVFHRVPGGSSSGSAVAVAAELAPFALGTDTGGSVRIPAAMNGLTGFKPSWGLVPDAGLVTLCSRFDVIGPIARTVADCWSLFDAISAETGSDRREVPRLDRTLRIGVADPVAYGSYSQAVLSVFRETCDLLAASGLKLEPFQFPVDVHEVLTRTACLIGHEAVREFGSLMAADPAALDQGVRARLTDAQRFTVMDYDREWTIREERCAAMRSAMAHYDAILFPTTPILPPRVDEIVERMMPLGDLTRVVNYLDLCAMALPTFHTSEGLRHSLQVIGLRGSDELVFGLSAEIERRLAGPIGGE